MTSSRDTVHTIPNIATLITHSAFNPYIPPELFNNECQNRELYPGPPGEQTIVLATGPPR